MKRFLFIALIFSSLNCFSQVGLNSDTHVLQTEIASFSKDLTFVKSPALATPTESKLPVPLVYSYDKLAFFCKIEVQLENVVKFPVKFRLGSVDYVDMLEGK